MEFELGTYIKKDLKRIKIDSAEEDIKNHFKILKGRINEIGSQYSIPLASTFLYQTPIDGIDVLFLKDRCATTNPKLSPRHGMRIVFALFVVEKNQ